MAYQMKDSPHKRGVIEGTDSALKLASLAYKAVTKGKKIYKAAKKIVRKLTGKKTRGENYATTHKKSHYTKEGTINLKDGGSITTKYFKNNPGSKLTTTKFKDGRYQELYESKGGSTLVTYDKYGNRMGPPVSKSNYPNVDFQHYIP